MPNTKGAAPVDDGRRKWVRRGSPGLQNPSSMSPKRSQSRRKTICEFVLRLDVFWTFFFFLFLICVAAVTSSITQALISNALLGSLHNVHDVRIATIKKGLDLMTERSFNMAAGFLSLHSQTAFAFNSEETLSQLCSILTAFDTSIDFRSLAVTSLGLREAISCMHGDEKLGSRAQLYGWMTHNSIIPALYLVNNVTFKFEQPLEAVYGGWPSSVYNLTDTYVTLLGGNPAFTEAEGYYNGSIEYIDYRTLWRSFAEIPHIIYCNIPAGFLFRDLKLAAGINVTDYVDVRVDGSTLLTTSNAASATGVTAAIFVNMSLTSDDPSVMANNWGQASNNDTEILTTYTLGQVTYLKASDISDSLMRAALKHVKLNRLQNEGYTDTVDFQFKGAPATVTAMAYTTPRGLMLPMVLVSSHADIALPYGRIMSICNGVTAVVIVIMTAVFWLFIHRELRNPLHSITNLLLASVKRGSRALFRSGEHDCFALTEVQQLGAAHNAAMRQLREIDTFIPEAVRHEILEGRDPNLSIVMTNSQVSQSMRSSLRAHSKLLLTHLSTVVYITIRPLTAAADARGAAALHHGAAELPERHRLAAIVANAARAGEGSNTGPFSSSAALSSFAEKLHELSDQHNGMVLRLSPDSCVLHFNKAVRGHLFVSASASMRSCSVSTVEPHAEQRRREQALARDEHRTSKQDAKDALAFTFALQEWLEGFAAGSVPDVRMLVDTSTFTCGHYRPHGSERTSTLALGRDVQREVGGMPLQIGTRITMTEETASCVRAGQRNAATGELETGVRQIPVEALRTGRADLDADVMVLYEALPGPVLECKSWQRYQKCCFDGFSCMVRGDYPAALSLFKDIADIVNLEPGLMPRCLRREAASSNVTGGAVSTQVERLMKECVSHALRGCTDGYHRSRRVPLGIDAVLRCTVRRSEWLGLRTTKAGTALRKEDEIVLAKREGRYGTEAHNAFFTRTPLRYVAVFSETQVRTSYSGRTDTIVDNWGTKWTVAKKIVADRNHEMHDSMYYGLSDTGDLSALQFQLYQQPPTYVSKVLQDAPAGLMTDAMRSATPVWEPSTELRAAIRTMLDARIRLRHPHILSCLGYSMELEGGLTTAFEYCKGGNLREVMARYDRMRIPTISRMTVSVLLALRYLHTNGVVHGELRPESVLVCSDGVYRVTGFYTDYKHARHLLYIPRTCYVSPEVAAGNAPTPASDVFGYGLLMLELLTQRLPWMWSPSAVTENGTPRCAEDLATLAAAGGSAFSAAVVQGLVIPAVDRLDSPEITAAHPADGVALVKRCLVMEPSRRESLQVCVDIAEAVSIQYGVKANSLLNPSMYSDDDDESSSVFGRMQ